MENVTERFLRREAEEAFPLNKDGSTALVRSGNGVFFVRKEVDRDSFFIYKVLARLSAEGRLRRIPKIYGLRETVAGGEVEEEFVAGETVADALERGMKFSEAEICSVVEALCDDLEVLHGLGFVHRDLSAGNIILTDNGPKILDFGISRAVEPGKDRDTRLLGTPGFAAPEQYGFSQSDARTDVYSLGALMRTMLTGGENIPADGPIGRVSSVCMRMDPRRRYKSVKKLRAELRRVRAALSKGKDSFRGDVCRLLPWLFLGLIFVAPMVYGDAAPRGALEFLLFFTGFVLIPAVLWTNFMGVLRFFGYNMTCSRFMRVFLPAALTLAAVFAVFMIYIFTGGVD